MIDDVGESLHLRHGVHTEKYAPKPGYGGELTAPHGGLMPAPPPAMGSHPPLETHGGPHTLSYHGHPSWRGPPGAGYGSSMPGHTTHDNPHHAPRYSTAPSAHHGGYGNMGSLTPYHPAHVHSGVYTAGGPGYYQPHEQRDAAHDYGYYQPSPYGDYVPLAMPPPTNAPFITMGNHGERQKYMLQHNHDGTHKRQRTHPLDTETSVLNPCAPPFDPDSEHNPGTTRATTGGGPMGTPPIPVALPTDHRGDPYATDKTHYRDQIPAPVNIGQVSVANLRHKSPSKIGDVYADRSSPIGNPFVMGPGGKDERYRHAACDAFKKLLEDPINADVKKIANDYGVPFDHRHDLPGSAALRVKEINRLADTVRRGGPVRLFCWCDPERCHAHDIGRLILRIAHNGTPLSIMPAAEDAPHGTMPPPPPPPPPPPTNKPPHRVTL